VGGLRNGEPFPVFGISPEISVVRTDTTVLWTMEEFSYLMEIDSAGRPLLLTRLGRDGQVLPGNEGAAYTCWEWDDHRHVTVFSMDSTGESMDVKLQPSTNAIAARLNDAGDLLYFSFASRIAAGLQYELDENGRTVARRAVDHAGETVISSVGAAEVRYGYDQWGNTSWTAYFDCTGQLMPGDYALPGEGNWEFDDCGVVRNGIDIAYIHREFDRNSLYISEQNIGLDGLPAEDREGRSLTLYRREIHGGISESVWFGLQGNRVEVAGVWATRRIYNSVGQVLETSTWDAGEHLTEFPGGFAFTRFSYTPSGGVEMISYYDLHGNPVVNTVQGCHARFHYYHMDGNLEEIQYLDTDYRLVNNSAGYARTVFSYDETGVKETHYDLNGSIL